MKKIMMMAMLLLASSAAFAGDSETLKAILKVKDYTEAEKLVKSSFGQLANDQEKAKAYNHVARLAYDAYKKQDDIATLNQQMGKKEPVDENVRSEGAFKALTYAIECDKFDGKPNEKGKVKVEYREKNQGIVPFIRQQILIAAQNEFNANNYQASFDYAKLFIDCLDAQLLSSDPKIDRSQNMGYAAYFAAVSAYNLKDMTSAGKYARIAMKEGDDQIRDYCFRLLIESVKKGELNTTADTANYIAQLQTLYKEFPDKEQLYASLMDAYMQTSKFDDAIKLSDERQAAFPESTLPQAYKGSIYMEKEEYEKAIEAFSKIPETDKNYLLGLYNIGCCYNNMATALNSQLSDARTNTITKENDAKVKDVLRNAKEYLEKVWQLDQTFQRKRLVYLLYNVYYRLGENDKAEEMNKILESES